MLLRKDGEIEENGGRGLDLYAYLLLSGILELLSVYRRFWI